MWLDKVVRSAPPEAGAGATVGNNTPQIGHPGTDPVPDPFHDATSFLGETNPEGILQWDDNRMNVPAAWAKTLGDRTVRVAVIDSGLDGSHKELAPNYDKQGSANTIPCSVLTLQFGPGLGQKDCSSTDTEGHGTWVGSRIAGAVNGFASNGVAPNVQVMGFKALSTTLGGGLTTWIVDGMIRACDADADLINMSLGGYDNPAVAGDVDDYMLWVAATNYCRSKGTAIFASAGNEHVRVNRVAWNGLTGVGRVDSGPEGVASIVPGTHRGRQRPARLPRDTRRCARRRDGLRDQQRHRPPARRGQRGSQVARVGGRCARPADVLLQLRVARGHRRPRRRPEVQHSAH